MPKLVFEYSKIILPIFRSAVYITEIALFYSVFILEP